MQSSWGYIPFANEDTGYKLMDSSPGRVGRRCVGPTTRPPPALPDEESINFSSGIFIGEGYMTIPGNSCEMLFPTISIGENHGAT